MTYQTFLVSHTQCKKKRKCHSRVSQCISHTKHRLAHNHRSSINVYTESGYRCLQWQCHPYKYLLAIDQQPKQIAPATGGLIMNWRGHHALDLLCSISNYLLDVCQRCGTAMQTMEYSVSFIQISNYPNISWIRLHRYGNKHTYMSVWGSDRCLSVHFTYSQQYMTVYKTTGSMIILSSLKYTILICSSLQTVLLQGNRIS